MAGDLGTAVMLVDGLTGGLGAAAVEEGVRLRGLGYEVVLARPDTPQPTIASDGLVEWGIPVPLGVRQVRKMWSAAQVLRQRLRALNGPVLIHAHGLRSFLIVLLSHAKATKVVTSYTAAPSSFTRRLAHQVLARTADLAVSVSPTDIPGWRHWWHFSPALQQPQVDFRSRTSSRLKVGWFGRLESPKRPDVWADICLSALDSGAEFDLVVAGDGPLRSQMLDRLGPVRERVTYLGHVPSPQEALERMDVLLLWSDSEGVPFSLQEAVWLGIPCLANPLPGIVGYFGDAPGCVSHSDAAQTLSLLLDDGKRREIWAEQVTLLHQRLSTGCPIERLVDWLNSRSRYEGSSAARGPE